MIELHLKDNSIFEDNYLNATALGKAAFFKYLNNNISSPTPLYLKKSSAEILLEEKHK